MKNILSLFLLIIFSTTSLRTDAQDYLNLVDANTVSIIGYWLKGESVNYHVTKSSSSFKGTPEKLDTKKNESYDFNLRIIDSTETSYDFEMTYSNCKMDENLPEYMRQIEELQSSLAIRYRTDEFGAFDTILNLVQLRKDLISKLEAVKKSIDAKEVDANKKEVFSTVFESAIQNFQNIGNIEALFLEDIIRVHGYYGIQMDLGIKSEIELSFPVIGDVILSGIGSMTLASISKTNNESIINIKGSPDKEELKEYMKSFVKLFTEDLESDSFANISLSMETKTVMKMELTTGWMKKISMNDTIKVNDGKSPIRKEVSTELVKF